LELHSYAKVNSPYWPCIESYEGLTPLRR